MLDNINTSYNKTNANIVAGFLVSLLVWLANSKLQWSVPPELAASGMAAIAVLLNLIVPNKEV